LGGVHVAGRMEVKSHVYMSSERDPEAAGAAAPGRPAGRRSELTQESLDGFLQCLGADRERAGAQYLAIHRNLVRFFEWRGCPFPEDHADEAITRVAKRIAGGEEIHDASTYVIGVARFLLLEIYKDQEKERRIAAAQPDVQVDSQDSAQVEHRAECLRRCLDQLSPANRELILQYYEGEKSQKINNRKQLTEKLQLSVNTLRMRALRIRSSLQECMEGCAA
jgi:RNA polymerase sigma factor (sigma-70 family)